ncbi:MAG: aminopeptidase N [Beijerinckiaceae bacterium]
MNQQSPIAAQSQLIQLADYTPPAFLVDTVDLLVQLHPTQTRVVVTSHYRPNPATTQRGIPLVLDGDELSLVSIALDGALLAAKAYTAAPDKLTLHEPPLKPFSLTIETVINPDANTKLMGLYRSNGIYCTQCEADGFRRISYFQDRPDVMARYRVRMEAEKADAPVLLANGNPVEAGDIAGTTRHFAVWDDPHPKPCYLFAIVGGDLGHISEPYVTSEGRKVELAIYVERGKEHLTGYAMDALIRSMRWDEEVFGLAYDLDVFNIVAVSDFNMGAMENKGLNIFNDKYVLASPETATDTDYAQIEAIIAHEYFHNWTGNRITCRDWFQLCLKEGLTVFRDQEFSSDMRSRAVKRIMDVKELRARQFTEDAGPLAHPVRPTAYSEINNFYTATVYEKGAEVIRMLKLLIGDAAFKAGMELYFQRHDGDAATIEQFLACFAETSQRDLTHFSQWYAQAGTPTLNVSRRYDTASNTLVLNLQQETLPTPGQPTKKPQVIPVAIGFTGDGKAAPHLAGPAVVSQSLIVLDTAETEVRVTGVAQAAVPSLLRSFSAPVNLVLDFDDKDLLQQASQDSDPFNRWQALQTLAMQTLMQSARAVQTSGQPHTHDGLAEAIDRLLQESASDPAFAALAIGLPSELDIARELKDNIDPDAIFAARKTLRKSIGQRVLASAHHVYETAQPDSTYTPDAKSAGRRALRNAALDWIIQGDAGAGCALAARQFETANNMTDQFAALMQLSHAGGEHREKALADFEKRFQDNALVMDKWFALQAAIPEAATLGRIRKLMSHPAFSMSNPNRARSLIGGFAMSNPTQFNRADGTGYEFVAEMILTLDKRNPQTASRIMTAFRSWSTLETARKARVKGVLEKMSLEKDLSRDVRDILDRTLA